MTLTRDRMRELLAAALVDDGLTQAEFARRVGVTQKHVSLVLSGKQFAGMETLDYWAYVLGREWRIELVRP